MKCCTCDYGAGRACVGQASLGDGWYCGLARAEAYQFAHGLPEPLKEAAFAAVDRGAVVEGGVLVLRADSGVARFGREP